MGIEQQLSGDIIDGLYNAPNPITLTNPVATIANITNATNTMPPSGDEKQYIQVTNFDVGATPTGWNSSVATGGLIGYTQVSENGVSPGMALFSITTSALSRASLINGSGFQYMRTLTDGPETSVFTQMRFSGTPSSSQTAVIFGWINSNTFNPPSALGNALAIMYDPANVSGFNPGLITNLFLIARSTYNGPTANTIVDLGVTFDAVNWRNFNIIYDNVLNQVRITRDNVLLTTLTNLANVPGGNIRGVIPAAASNGLKAGVYLGNGAVAAPASTGVRVSKMTIFKRYS